MVKKNYSQVYSRIELNAVLLLTHQKIDLRQTILCGFGISDLHISCVSQITPKPLLRSIGIELI